LEGEKGRGVSPPVAVRRKKGDDDIAEHHDCQRVDEGNDEAKPEILKIVRVAERAFEEIPGAVEAPHREIEITDGANEPLAPVRDCRVAEAVRGETLHETKR